MVEPEQIPSYLDNIVKELEACSKSKDKLYAKAYYLYESGKYNEAGQLFRLLTLADLTNSKHWMGLGATYQMLKEYDEAAAAYAVAALNDPSNPYPPLYAAECLMELGKWKDVVNALEDAEKLASQQMQYKELLPRILLLKKACIDKKKES